MVVVQLDRVSTGARRSVAGPSEPEHLGAGPATPPNDTAGRVDTGPPSLNPPAAFDNNPRGGDEPPSSPDVTSDYSEDRRPFSRWGADRVIMRALSSVGCFRRERDYRLLETVVPDLRGAFESAIAIRPNGTITTLATPSRAGDELTLPTVAAATNPFQNACAYLRGSTIGWEIAGILAPARIAGSGLASNLLAVPFYLAPMLTPGGFANHAHELREL